MYLKYLGKGPAGLNGLKIEVVSVSTTPYNVPASEFDNGRLYAVNAAGAPITVNLPDPAVVGSKFVVIIKKVDSSVNAVTVNRTGSATIDGATAITIGGQYDVLEVVTDGTNWLILEKTADSFYSTLSSSNRTGGNFGTAPDNTIFYDATAALATAYTATYTREIITSIQVTNITSIVRYVDAYQRDALLSTDYPFAYQMPIYNGQTVELLKKPKIMYINDLIKIKADAASAIAVQITVARYNSSQNLFKSARNHPIADVTGYGTVYQESGSAGSVVDSILLVNGHGQLDSNATVRIFDGVSTFSNLTYQMIIPAGSSVEVMENTRFIPNGSEIQVQVGDANRITTHVATRRR